MSKKAAATKAKEETTYQIRDVVLAKVRGYPAWPGQIVDPDTVAKDVLKERPLGKNAKFYCVRFFPVGDHAWVQSKDMSRLQLHEIQAYINEPHKKSGDLLRGYQIAMNPDQWEKDQAALADERAAAEEENEVDELGEEEGDDDEEGEEKLKASKKRKRAEPKEKKAAKEVKDSSKSKAKRKGGRKSSSMVESEDEGGEAGPSKSAPPASKKAKKEVKEVNGADELDNDPEAAKVKDMRHKLQRAFLSKTAPKAEDMDNLDKLFKDVEEYGMTIQYLQYSKIGKVMRHIAALKPEQVPRDDELTFRERAQNLVNKWHTTVSNTADSKASGLAVNGSAKTNGAPVPESAMSDGVPPMGAGEVMMDTTLGDVTMMTDVAA